MFRQLILCWPHYNRLPAAPVTNSFKIWFECGGDYIIWDNRLLHFCRTNGQMPGRTTLIEVFLTSLLATPQNKRHL
jgi:hypothetical protein